MDNSTAISEQDLFSTLTMDNINIDNDILERAKNGDDMALYQIGEIYNESGDAIKSKMWYSLSAKKNNAGAQYRLGNSYYHDQSSPDNYHKAMAYYIKSFYNGNIDACVDIGFIYDNGLGVIQDYRLAMNWYLKAANCGNLVAQFNIGVLYEYGNGVNEDKKKALEWYQRSASQGYEMADYKITKLHNEGYYLDEDETACIEREKNMILLEKFYKEKITHLESKLKTLENQIQISEQKNQEMLTKNEKEIYNLKLKSKQRQTRTDERIRKLENLLDLTIKYLPIDHHNDLCYDDDNDGDINHSNSS